NCCSVMASRFSTARKLPPQMSGVKLTVSWWVTSENCSCGTEFRSPPKTTPALLTRFCDAVELPVSCGDQAPRWASALNCATRIAASADCRLGLCSTDWRINALSGSDWNAAHQRAETSAPEIKCWPATCGPPGPALGEASLPGR